MLFAVKNRFWLTLLFLAVFVAGSIWAKDRFGLVWGVRIEPETLKNALFGAAALIVSDALIQAILRSLLGQRYQSRYRALVHYFRPQGGPEIVASGLLAGSEEMVFRGIVLESLLSWAGWTAAPAIAMTAVAFGILHTSPQRALRPFAVWAAWEGVLLSCLYVMTGSVVVCMSAHALHDMLGYGLFAYQRRTGWLL